MFASDALLRLPPAAALLVLSFFLSFTDGHALPRQTKTIELREIDALPWPLQPVATPAPTLRVELRLRQLNTVCGYIGGDPDLPATCSAGSHCAVDVAHGAIGCCPDGGTCTQGIFTGCVDANSDPQTEINPYVYTCSGSNVCYKNAFDGGYFQYGCGSTSGLGTSVVMTASGKETLDIGSVSVEFTAEPSTLSEPTTIGSRTKTDETTTTRTTETTKTTETTSETTSETKTSSSSTTTDAATTTDGSSMDDSTNTGTSAPGANDDDDTNVGAIVGGSVGGVAALVAMVSLGMFLWRRKMRNTRQGPDTAQETRYVSPLINDRHHFEPLPTMQEVDENEMPQTVPPAHRTSGEISRDSNEGGAIPYNPTYPYGYGPGSMAGGITAVGGGDDRHMEPDQVPLTREIDDFSQGFNTALDEIQEDNTQQSNDYNMGAYPGPRGGGGGRPLWQQNRRRSHNLTWM